MGLREELITQEMVVELTPLSSLTDMSVELKLQSQIRTWHQTRIKDKRRIDRAHVVFDSQFIWPEGLELQVPGEKCRYLGGFVQEKPGTPSSKTTELTFGCHESPPQTTSQKQYLHHISLLCFSIITNFTKNIGNSATVMPTQKS